MSVFCQKCDKRDTCRAICPELENYLNRKVSDKELLAMIDVEMYE